MRLFTKKVWEHLLTNRDAGEIWQGHTLLQGFESNEFLCSELEWFRAAVEDVRRSMGISNAQVAILEIRIYEQLRIEKVTTGLRRLMFWKSPPIRERRGMVAYGEKPTLYLSRDGLRTPRVVYEEVAHSLSTLKKYEGSGASCKEKEDRYFREFAAAVTQGKLQCPQTLAWPIMCHLDIFRGFLNDSDAFRRSSENDQAFAVGAVQKLQRKQLCRLTFPESCVKCHC